MKLLKLFIFTAILLLIPALANSQVYVGGELYPSYYTNVTDMNSVKSEFNLEGFTTLNYFGEHVNALVEVSNTTTDLNFNQAVIELDFNLKQGALGLIYAGKFENPWQGVYRGNMYSVNRSVTVGLLPSSFTGAGFGLMTLKFNADVILGNVNDSVKSLFIQANTKQGNFGAGVFMSGDVGLSNYNPYFGGKVTFNSNKFDALIEGIFKSEKDVSLRQDIRGTVTYNIPNTGLGLFGEYVNRTQAGSLNQFGITGAVLYSIHDVHLAGGWNGYKNTMDGDMVHLAFLSASYIF